ncbi:MAG: translation initiation factor IF-2 subunit gamma [Candidatus Caldarchaeum sp.]|nr:translation initiation factor IF-2 subunit gamma [Candidatus Caldarchaeum sp.]MDW8359400.1 translation initiation factor IF-2 subunit gamma [Candidatus Caldarchaeum sp.]
MAFPKQPEVNIGTLGHVDNGKSTVVQSITGVWTGRHSEELKRGITIRLGYADAAIYRCHRCHEPFNNYPSKTCPVHGSENEFVRVVSFIDCPGHHSLMVTMLSGAALFDGAVFVADARQTFPQPQDSEHLQAARILGIKNMIVAQNKIDLVSRERALENYREITAHFERSGFESVPVIPVSGQHSVGIDVLLTAIEKVIPTPQRDLSTPVRMPVLRSFDVNVPGTPAKLMKGAVIGGSIVHGVMSVGDELELVPGIAKVKQGRTVYEPVSTEVTSLMAGGKRVEKAYPGGLTGVETTLDPALGKGDGLVGNIAGAAGSLPPVWNTITLEYSLFEKVLGVEGDVVVKQLAEKEVLVVNVLSAVSSGVVVKRGQSLVELQLTRPVAADPGSKVAISRKVGTGWRLIGYGKIVGS